MSTDSQLREQLLATAKAYTEVHSALDIEGITKLCDPSCRHRGGPRSLPSIERNNAEYAEWNKQVFPAFLTYSASITDALVDEKLRKVVLYIDAHATATAGTYDAQYVITLTMTDDGKLVKDHYDFIDTQVMVEFSDKLTGSGVKLPEK